MKELPKSEKQISPKILSENSQYSKFKHHMTTLMLCSIK